MRRAVITGTGVSGAARVAQARGRCHHATKYRVTRCSGSLVSDDGTEMDGRLQSEDAVGKHSSSICDGNKAVSPAARADASFHAGRTGARSAQDVNAISCYDFDQCGRMRFTAHWLSLASCCKVGMLRQLLMCAYCPTLCFDTLAPLLRICTYVS